VPSIERSLLCWVLGALAIASAVLAVATYELTLDEMDEVYDSDLKNVAAALASHAPGAAGQDRARSGKVDPAEIVTVIWSADGRRLFSSDPRVDIPFATREGIARVTLAGDEWIVYTRAGPGGFAQAAHRGSARNESAAESASKILVPMTAMALVVAGLMVLALRRGLRPLDAVSRSIAARSAASLTPVSLQDVPREVLPLVGSINALMARLSVAFTAQRRFMADAAHELRTPVTALRLQLQLLQRAGDQDARELAIAQLEAGIHRSQRLIEQLLQVARSEPDAEGGQFARVDLSALARDVVAAMSVRAHQMQVDLGAQAGVAVSVEGDAGLLDVLLTNLVDNALRYTPAGGVVDVAVGRLDGRPVIRVIDTGPGVPEAERERVFERFYRSPEAARQARDAAGSGLGLAIVKAIATRHRAAVSLHSPAGGGGLEVRVLFEPPA
jgi:signal transduction histidine kinase